ncbi:hypothetical protein AAJ72_09235 [Citromicrobium sp. RCC1885]|uniref:hypothetical protein n=1 Tax=unclassified Citromicrobium TaxID=2630544 RepID=UPI0006C90BED|nr:MULTISPECIES: hypothetical protein [unclassified Citromicrobium]KPM23089.1 hypothetical protein AAJ72_09235 [Citromicrobium sp. RCC1885]KPM26496.1 hypothetical protein AAJ74_09975 [Citromicrobium sp. RCC1878]MAO03972.1 pyridoxal phosphate biosynthetic protein [Citromicrobium sp.]OAM08992.1 hypothetical protein A0U43_10330 [Citromicrobium sp. RCC1897]
MSAPAEITRSQRFWPIAGAIPFLLSIFLLGVSLNSGALTVFAVVWPLLQVGGYTMTLRLAKGDTSHDLVKTQVILHYVALILLVVLLVRAS